MRKIPGPRRLTALLWLLALARPLAAQIPGEVNGSPDTGNHRGATPFVASPFAPEFVITGNETDIGGDFYIPSNGDGTFGTNTAIPDLGHVDGTDVADMDNDGDNDFVSCDGTAGVDGTVFLYVNGGDGSFTPSPVATGITSTIFCTNLRIADFDNNGLNDFVVGDFENDPALGTRVYVQGPIGTFIPSATLDTSWTGVGSSLFGVAAGDFDGDGNADVLMLGYLNSGAGEARFYAGGGDGTFSASTLLFDLGVDFGDNFTTGLAMFDLEGDGDLDVVAGGGTTGEHYIYTNDGTGNLTTPAMVAFDLDANTGLDAFDADGDGDHDLVAVAFTGGLLYLENLGGTLAAPITVDAVVSGIGVGAPPLTGAPINLVEIPTLGSAGLAALILLLTTASLKRLRRR